MLNGFSEWKIESEYLKPVIKSPRECKSIRVDPSQLQFKLFMCHKDKAALAGTAALDYIKWGETQGYHQRPSCKGRTSLVGFGAAGDSVACFQLPDFFNCKNFYSPPKRLLYKRQFSGSPRGFRFDIAFVCFSEFFTVSTDGQIWQDVLISAWRSAENSDL